MSDRILGSSMRDTQALAPSTLAIHLGRPAPGPNSPLNEPITPVTAFHAGGELGYVRDGNPGWLALEAAIGPLEGGTAVAVSSGIATVDAIIDLLPIGAQVVLQHICYSGTSARLNQHNASGRIQLRREPLHQRPELAAGAQLVWIETPANPTLEVVDIAAVAQARSAGALLVVDNTVATPLQQRPLTFGADIVVHSATKSISGHSDAMLGLAVAADPVVADRLRAARAVIGCVPGVLESYLVLRGLRTLPLRARASSSNAQELADRLLTHPSVLSVDYPTLPGRAGSEVASRQMSTGGALLSFRVRGGADAAEAVAERTELWIHATSLGGVESTLERRKRWPMESDLVPEDLIRLSVGCEDVDDLWNDLAAALAAA